MGDLFKDIFELFNEYSELICANWFVFAMVALISVLATLGVCEAIHSKQVSEYRRIKGENEELKREIEAMNQQACLLGVNIHPNGSGTTR